MASVLPVVEAPWRAGLVLIRNPVDASCAWQAAYVASKSPICSRHALGVVPWKSICQTSSRWTRSGSRPFSEFERQARSS